MKYSALSTIIFASTSCFAHLIPKNEASNMISNPMNGLSRSRRANKKFGSFEENFMKSDLDRECASEDCGQEEYDEIFENYVKSYRDLEDYRNALFGAYQGCARYHKTKNVTTYNHTILLHKIKIQYKCTIVVYNRCTIAEIRLIQVVNTTELYVIIVHFLAIVLLKFIFSYNFLKNIGSHGSQKKVLGEFCDFLEKKCKVMVAVGKMV